MSRAAHRALAALAALGALGAGLAAGGCSEYARVSMRNAPGATDLATPIQRENGDPQRFEPAQSPGARTLAVFTTPSFLFGAGRRPLPARKAAFEPGIELRFERHTGRDHDLIGRTALAVTAGVGFAQIVDTRPTIAGPLFAEVNYRFLLGGAVPVDVGLGPVVYPSELDAGGQLTARLMLLAMVRTRYLADGGFEIWGGFEIPFPFFFGWSR